MTTNRVVRSACTVALVVVVFASGSFVTTAEAQRECFESKGQHRYSPTHVKYIDGTLHRSAVKGVTEAVEKLLNAGANPDAKNSYGWAPLHVAAYAGQNVIVEALLNAGANPNVIPVEESYSGEILKHCAGMTPLHFAGRAGHTEIVDALLAAGADANATAGNGTTPIYFADRAGHVDTVVSLLTAGATQ